ncbi:Mercuric reductase [bacterium HR19]|nr:Mercuric reductase [bacterium HR19]
MKKGFDLIVIGGGAAGFAAVIKANELGAKALMVNSGLPIGGTCVNVGCVPSKRLIHLAQILHVVKSNSINGIKISLESFDFSKVITDEIELVRRMREEKYINVLKNLKNVQFIEGKAEFLSEREIRVNGETYIAEKFVLAVGSKTGIPPIEGLKETGFITHIEALSLKNRPRELMIVGAGPMGLEFGQLFSRFGTRVTILEFQPTIFGPGEREIVIRLQKILEKEGIVIKTNAKVLSAKKESGKKVLTYLIDGEKYNISGDEILVAAGKVPNTDGLGLERAGVEIDERKAIVVNEYLETSNKNIYAAGDCINQPLRLETTAGKEGSIAAENALTGSKKSIDYSSVPYTIFTDPELAGVGLTEAELMKRLGRCSCRVLELSNVPRAIINDSVEGAVKLVVHPDTKQILGVHILAPNAGEIISYAMVIVKSKMTIYDVLETLPVFPSLSEAVKLCALSFIKDVSKLSCCV